MNCVKSIAIATAVFSVIGLTSCCGTPRSESAAVTPGKIDISTCIPTASRTEKGYYRYDYYSYELDEQSEPVDVIYFNKVKKPIDPLNEIQLGMSKSEVIAILGEPFQDGVYDDTMAFKSRGKVLMYTFDDNYKVRRVRTPPPPKP